MARADPGVIEAHVGMAMVHMDQADLNSGDSTLARAALLNPRNPQLITARKRRQALASSSQPVRR